MRIRTGLPEDLDRITAVEAACFPPAEAATAEDFAGRLAHYAGQWEQYLNLSQFLHQNFPDQIFLK